LKAKVVECNNPGPNTLGKYLFGKLRWFFVGSYNNFTTLIVMTNGEGTYQPTNREGVARSDIIETCAIWNMFFWNTPLWRI
jgi:hypothetical protein